MNIAAELADPPMLELLADAGFSLDERGHGGIGNFGTTPLMTAISRGRMENADWLIGHGADVSAVDRYGNSALVGAMVDCNDRVLVARLIDAGAVPNDKALRIARHLGVNLDAAPVRTAASEAPVVRGGIIERVEPGQRPVIPPANSTPPLIAPPSFGNLPPPLTDAELEQQWPRPDPQDLDAEPLRSASPTRYAEVTADFDGDGKPDRAVLRVGATGWKEGLFVRLSSVLPDKWQPLNSVVHDQQSRRLQMGVSLVPPGTYLTACGKGYGRCPADAPREVVLKHPGISYFQFESAASYVFWDEELRQLQRVWISD
jgi:hypothetical protein